MREPASPASSAASASRIGSGRSTSCASRRRSPATVFEPASLVLRDLRIVKDADEVALLRLAAQAADRVVDEIAHGRLVGRTEADVAREVRDRLVAEGHDSAEFAIVGSGPNSASPHHEASDRVIRAGRADRARHRRAAAAATAATSRARSG